MDNIAAKKMKRIVLYALLAAMLCGCSSVPEDMGNGAPRMESSGMRVEFLESFPFTKGTSPMEASLVDDLNLYIFDPEGILVYSEYFPDGNVGTQEISLYTKKVYSVYAIANWGKREEVGSLSQLLGLTYRVPDVKDVCISGGVPVMTGQTEAEFPFDGPLQIEMGRMVGKVSVVCNSWGVNDDVSIKVTGVSLKNVPMESTLFGSNKAVEVTDGVTFEGDDLASIMYDGVTFYMLENVQGEVPGAVGNKEKAEMLGAERRELCSYIEIDAEITTYRHRGNIVYRFFLGTEDDNCNVLRNNHHMFTVEFKGDVSEEENSVSVDNGALLDRVTGIHVSPSFIAFSPGLGKTYQCTATIYPETAFDKRIIWSSSLKRVAKVDQNGVITTVGPGTCYIFATSVENPSARGEVEIQVR